ncbi:MAG: hypothetical protein IPM35_38155 [Myxococcales bacterium]|nr:hypothetical protein [Myxococcales bacterium]
MHRRASLSLLVVALCAAVAAVASAAPGDAAAKKKIDRAINEHYVVTKFDNAEALLLDAIRACGGQCSASTIAKAWMYVGVVRGSGKNNQKGANEAFLNALGADPKIALDDAIATPETKKTFAAARRAKGSSAVDVPVGGDEGETSGGPLECLPKVSEVQLRHPIPVSCSAAGAKRLELRYKAGSGGWKSLKMKKRGDAFQTTIPCEAVQKKGTLRFYVRAWDENGDPAGSYGKKADPNKVSLVRDSDEEPPAFPGKDPPRRCPRASAEAEEEEEAPSCESTDDCDMGLSCVEGSCRSKKAPARPGKNSWIGLHFAYDLALAGGTAVCSRDSQLNNGYACFYKDTEDQYRFEPQPRYANDISTGLAPATARVLVSFDQMVGSGFSVGVRAGYAFGGGPPSGKDRDVKFLPFHAEGRLSYWIGGGTGTIRPYVGVGGGAAQVDAKLPVTVGDCAGVPGGAPSQPGASFAQDAAYYDSCKKRQVAAAPLELDVYKKLGKGFVGVHGGAVFAVTPDSGVKVELGVMQTMPTSGQVIEPSLGYVVGF